MHPCPERLSAWCCLGGGGSALSSRMKVYCSETRSFTQNPHTTARGQGAAPKAPPAVT